MNWGSDFETFWRLAIWKISLKDLNIGYIKAILFKKQNPNGFNKGESWWITPLNVTQMIVNTAYISFKKILIFSLHFTGTPAANRQTHAGSCSGFEEGLGRWTAVQLDQNWQVVPLQDEGELVFL